MLYPSTGLFPSASTFPGASSTNLFPGASTFPGTTLWPNDGAPPENPAPQLVWDRPEDRLYHTGTDRGVIYTSSGPAVWNGIMSVDEDSDSSSTLYYIDGRIYLADVDPGDYRGRLTAYSWPAEFDACIGIPEIADGLYADNQKPKQFDLSYRTLIGSGLEGDLYGYQMHLIYNAMAIINTRSRRTVNQTPTPVEFSFDLVATPVAVPGFRPTAHYIIDTRNLDAGTIEELEGILYGSNGLAPRMPTPAELYDILYFGSAITFTTFTHPTLGLCWRARGSHNNLEYTSETTWVIRNVNGTDNGDGTYILEDTP